jgi:hypothetical protein
MAAGRNERNVTIENATLVLRNFEGKEDKYNRKGNRNFGILLSPELAETMAKDGWNVKFFKVREDGGEPQAWLQVSVAFDRGRPPRIVMITSRGRTPIDEETAELLDWVDIAVADVIIRPYDWSVQGENGVKAYLKTLFVTIEEDELELKYANVEDAPARNGRTVEPEGES